MGRKLEDNESSVGLKTPSNSSFHTRGENFFGEVLLTWEKRWTVQKITEVFEYFPTKLPDLESTSFYYSENLSKTLLWIKYKEGSCGFKREYFSFGKRSAGTKILIGQEVP